MRKLILAMTLLFATVGRADVGFENLTAAEFKDIIEDFASVFTHTSVAPASSLGKIFGFEIGLIVGAAKTADVEKLSKEIDPSADVARLPHAGLLGVLTFPFGLSGELNFLPEIENSDIHLKTHSLGAKWTITDVYPLPVDLAVKLHSATSTIRWNQPFPVSGVEYEQTVSGLLLQVSKKFTIFEPYLNLGSVKASGKLSAASSDIFDPSYTSALSAEENVSGGMFMVGFNANLLFVKLGAEAGSVLGNNKMSLKASLYF